MIRSTFSVLILLFALLTVNPSEAALIDAGATPDEVIPNNGQCTLREAILNANLPAGGDVTGGDCAAGDPGFDIVQIAPGHYELTLSGPNEDAGLTGDLDLLDDVELRRAAGPVTIDGLADDRVIDVGPGVGTISVTLDKVQVVNGFSGQGGGVRSLGAHSLTLENAGIRDNFGSVGGGVYVNGGDLFVNIGIIRDNDSNGSGGGIFFSGPGTLDFNFPAFYDNSANSGAGAYVSGTGSVTISGFWQGNVAGISGGGLSINSPATLTDVNFYDNVAFNGQGGGLYYTGPLLTISGFSDFFRNEAKWGGGMSAFGPVESNGAKFRENIATVSGGGISAGAAVTLNGGEIKDNQAQIGGGIVVSSNASLDAQDVTIDSNVSFGRGGGIDIGGPTVLDRVTVSGNTSFGPGGGISHLISTLDLRHSSVWGNEANGGEGGGLNVIGTAEIFNSTISGNSSTVRGGGISCGFNSLCKLDYVTMAENSAPNASDAIYAWVDVEVMNSIVADNGEGDACSGGPGSVISMGYCVDEDGSCAGGGPGDLASVNPFLGPLTETNDSWVHPLMAPSPAVDNASPGCGTLAGPPVAGDQRAMVRPVDGDGNGITGCDRGAFEAPNSAPLIPPPTSGLRLAKGNASGTIIDLRWDVLSCTSSDFHLLTGDLEEVTLFDIEEAVCDLGQSGRHDGYVVSDVDTWLLIVGNDDVDTEGTWGEGVSGPRNGATTSGSCGMLVRDNAGTCP